MKIFMIIELIIIALISLFWAYTTVDKLLKTLGKGVTLLDLSMLYISGLISGFAIGLLIVYVFKKKEPFENK